MPNLNASCCLVILCTILVIPSHALGVDDMFDRYYVRGGRSRTGIVLESGDFVPRIGEKHDGGGAFIVKMNTPPSLGGSGSCYECRSGRILTGICWPDHTDVFKLSGDVFIPTIDSRIRSVASANRAGVLDRPVWNDFFPLWTAETFRRSVDGLPAASSVKPPVRPPEGGLPSGYDWFPVSKLNQKKRPYDIRVVGGVAEVGFLRDDGEFIPDYERAPFKWEDVYNAPFDLDARGDPRLYTLPLDGAKSEDAYEFRSGRLIRGVLYDTGTFVPEMGSVVTAFGKYDPESDKRRIYNLPGILTKRK